MVADKELGGIKLIAFDNQFMSDYAISGISRFILIDPDRHTVKSNTPRSSDPKPIELFTEWG